MHIVFDLDYTLLDTAALKNALADAVTAHGPSREDYERTYRETVKREGKVYDYDPDAHLDLLADAFPDEAARDAARRGMDGVLARSEEFLYPGVKELLTELRDHGAELTLLTLGNEKWQHAKVDRSGLRGLFDEVIATEKEKSGVISKIAGKDRRTIVVNDNGKELVEMQERAPELTYVLKRGPKEVPKGLDLPEADTIAELADVLGKETGWELDVERHEGREARNERRRPKGPEGREASLY